MNEIYFDCPIIKKILSFLRLLFKNLNFILLLIKIMIFYFLKI